MQFRKDGRHYELLSHLRGFHYVFVLLVGNRNAALSDDEVLRNVKSINYDYLMGTKDSELIARLECEVANKRLSGR